MTKDEEQELMILMLLLKDAEANDICIRRSDYEFIQQDLRHP